MVNLNAVLLISFLMFSIGIIGVLIRRNALVLVDTSVTRHEDVVDGGLYAYTLWGRPDIRRFLPRRDGWLLVGQSPGV